MKRSEIIKIAGQLGDACMQNARKAEHDELFAPFGLAAKPIVSAADWYALSGFNGGFADIANKSCGEWTVRFAERQLRLLMRTFKSMELSSQIGGRK